jgi:co-chaperonin GroES (HSP10)
MAFPRKPILDRVIVRETPIEDIFEQGKIALPLESSHVKLRTDRGIVEAVGDCIVMGSVVLPIPVEVGDTVFFDEFAMCDPVYLTPADAYRNDLPKYWMMRVGDLKGVAVASPETVNA